MYKHIGNMKNRTCQKWTLVSSASQCQSQNGKRSTVKHTTSIPF